VTTLRDLRCPGCGAALAIPEDVTQVTCAYCHTPLTVEDRPAGPALVRRAAEYIAAATREDGERTRGALRRVELETRRGHLERELRADRDERAEVKAEILARLTKKWTIMRVGQAELFKRRERELRDRIAGNERELRAIEAELGRRPDLPTLGMPWWRKLARR
jgi:LSD1 subclass zinc finger protein